MAEIIFDNDDGSGDQTIASSWPAPANRFQNWIPKPAPIGEMATAVGDGRRYQWTHRVDRGASFELPGIAQTNESILQAFKEWADAGGIFTVDTEDSEGNIYSECQLAPGALVEWEPERRLGKWFTLSLDVIDVGVINAPMRCIY